MSRQIGVVTHYFNRIGVAALELSDVIRAGDCIRVVGYTTEFAQVVCSLEINHRPVSMAGPGMDVALKMVERVRVGDRVYRLSGEEAEEALATMGAG